jgi:hypothetical protein
MIKPPRMIIYTPVAVSPGITPKTLKTAITNPRAATTAPAIKFILILFV